MIEMELWKDVNTRTFGVDRAAAFDADQFQTDPETVSLLTSTRSAVGFIGQDGHTQQETVVRGAKCLSCNVPFSKGSGVPTFDDVVANGANRFLMELRKAPAAIHLGP
ncbi:hypothetical protein [Mesorhizobium sp. LNHC252B00]|uniref:hypothetical protein n=1 Tax=Mesorhizobium sp. LNHC252B00 TaxID=1287252 RepID=UPI0012EB3E62|nr:hypothetical protein [Mesorhizobium sp. LNHC252B00]